MAAVTVHSVQIHSGIVEEDEGHVSLVLSEAVQHRSVSVVVLHIPVNPGVNTEQLQTAESLLEINPAFSLTVYNRTFPCMEANYPYAIKNQRGARNTPSRGYFCDELVLYCIRELA